MKKLLVVLLALTFVVSMATASFAVTTASVDGKVEWTLTNADQFGGSVDGKIVFDLAKDFGEGYSAGLKIKLTPGDNATISGTDVDKNSSVAYDGDGWIKMVKDFGTLTFQTGGLGGNAANELGVGYDMSGNAGVKFENTSWVEGLALTVVINDERWQDKDLAGTVTVDYGDYYDYLLKGVYTNGALTLGAGYQAHTIPAAKTDSTKNDAMAVWAGYKIGDSLNLGLEYGSRPNMDGFSGATAVTGSTAIQVKADYTAGALTINGKALMTTGSYWLLDPDDKGTISAWNFFKYGIDRVAGTHVDPKDGTGVAGTAVKIDAAYKITDALSVNASVEDILDGAVIGTTGTALTSKQLMSYKVGASDKLTDALTLSGYYAGYGDLSEIELKAEYTFAAGLVGSLELKSDATVGVATPVNTYTAKITATL